MRRPLAWWLGVLGALFLGVGCILGLGHLAAPALLDVPQALATPQFGSRGIAAGAAAMEAAFWLGALACAVVAFRVMEALFRREDVRVVERLPISPAALFVDRALAALVESALFGGVCALFFVPLAWRGAPLVAGLCAALLFGGLIATSAVAIGTNIWMGAQYGGSKVSGDAYGGQGGIFILAPGVSLGISVVTLLLLKLTLGEVLHAGEVTNAFWLGLGIAGSVALTALLLGLRHFVASYIRVAAFFNEAEFVGFEGLELDYQKSAYLEPRRGERFLPRHAVPAYRRDVLQYPRRFMLLRYVYVLALLLAGGALLGLSPAAFPAWAVVVVPGALFAVVGNVWHRLLAPELSPRHHRLLPVRPESELLAASLFALREMAAVTGIYALAVVVIRGVKTGAWGSALILGLTAALLPVAINGLMCALRAFGLRWLRPFVTIAPPMLLIALAALATTSIPAALVAVVAGTAGHLALLGARPRTAP